MSGQRKFFVATVAAVLLLCVGTALAAAPGVLYVQPTGVNTAGATLHGWINPSDKQSDVPLRVWADERLQLDDGRRATAQVEGVATCFG